MLKSRRALQTEFDARSYDAFIRVVGSDLGTGEELLADRKAGPHSPLIFLYFLVVAASPLRLSLRLVYASTLGAMAAATLMMGGYVFGLIGQAEYYAPTSTLMVPRSSEIVFLLSLGAAGLGGLIGLEGAGGDAVVAARGLDGGEGAAQDPLLDGGVADAEEAGGFARGEEIGQ